MPIYDGNIVIGRSKKDLKTMGLDATIKIGFGDPLGEEKDLSTYLDINKPHVILICGKRGYGKSYTMGVMLEEIVQQMDNNEVIRNSLSAMVIDTMGIYWALKYPNRDPEEKELLEDYPMSPQSFTKRVKVFIPAGFKEAFKKNKLEYDRILSIRPGELEVVDWLSAFNIDQNIPTGILMTRLINELKETFPANDFGFKEIFRELQKIERLGKSGIDFAQRNVIQAARNRFVGAEDWGIFQKEGTSIFDLVKPGQVSVIDVSGYRQYIGEWGVRSLIVGFLAKKIYRERTLWRRVEEGHFAEGNSAFSLSRFPKVWMFMDEAHQFVPRRGSPPSLPALREWIRQGRSPGLSLVLATQQPGRLVQDAVSQCDIIISHRLTAKDDRTTLSGITPSYAEDIPGAVDTFGKKVGTALVLDDNSEEVYVTRIRPRRSHHAGREPLLLGG